MPFVLTYLICILHTKVILKCYSETILEIFSVSLVKHTNKVIFNFRQILKVLLEINIHFYFSKLYF